MKIRKATLEDTRGIKVLITSTIKCINSKEYHPRLLKHELSCYTLPKIRKYIQDKLFFIAVEKDVLVGVILLDIENTIIKSLYVKYDMIGKGIGKNLLQFMELKARKLGIKELTLYPTKSAENFYKKYGYKIKGTFIGTENGGFPVVDMRKKLI